MGGGGHHHGHRGGRGFYPVFYEGNYNPVVGERCFDHKVPGSYYDKSAGLWCVPAEGMGADVVPADLDSMPGEKRTSGGIAPRMLAAPTKVVGPVVKGETTITTTNAALAGVGVGLATRKILKGSRTTSAIAGVAAWLLLSGTIRIWK